MPRKENYFKRVDFKSTDGKGIIVRVGEIFFDQTAKQKFFEGWEFDVPKNCQFSIDLEDPFNPIYAGYTIKELEKIYLQELNKRYADRQ